MMGVSWIVKSLLDYWLYQLEQILLRNRLYLLTIPVVSHTVRGDWRVKVNHLRWCESFCWGVIWLYRHFDLHSCRPCNAFSIHLVVLKNSEALVLAISMSPLWEVSIGMPTDGLSWLVTMQSGNYCRIILHVESCLVIPNNCSEFVGCLKGFPQS